MVAPEVARSLQELGVKQVDFDRSFQHLPETPLFMAVMRALADGQNDFTVCGVTTKTYGGPDATWTSFADHVASLSEAAPDATFVDGVLVLDKTIIVAPRDENLTPHLLQGVFDRARTTVNRTFREALGAGHQENVLYPTWAAVDENGLTLPSGEFSDPIFSPNTSLSDTAEMSPAMTALWSGITSDPKANFSHGIHLVVVPSVAYGKAVLNFVANNPRTSQAQWDVATAALTRVVPEYLAALEDGATPHAGDIMRYYSPTP